MPTGGRAAATTSESPVRVWVERARRARARRAQVLAFHVGEAAPDPVPLAAADRMVETVGTHGATLADGLGSLLAGGRC